MEQTNPLKKIRESDSYENFQTGDEASYYLGDTFELGGVKYGPRFIDKILNEKDYVGVGPKNFHRSDEDLFHEVCETLTDNPRLDASQIQVIINEGCVYLKGRVNGRMDKREAERSIEFIPGVRDVMNELHIKS